MPVLSYAVFLWLFGKMVRYAADEEISPDETDPAVIQLAVIATPPRLRLVAP
jgi:hypothetical protein